MIPKKTKTEDLDAQINSDITKAHKAQEEQKKKIGKNRPRLAQAVTSKYLKIFILLIFFLVIGYKMFFAPTPNEPRKKRITKNKVIKKSNNKEIEQQRFADKPIYKSSSGEVYKEKPDSKSVVSFDSQTISNSESLGSVSVPKLNIPSVPTLPTIDKISLKEGQSSENEKEKQEKQEKQSKKKEIDIDGKKDVVTVKKIKKKIRDSNGNIKIVEVDVEVDKNGNIIKENERNDGSEKSISIFGNKTNIKAKKNHPISNELGLNALDEMFVLNGKGFSGQQKNSKVSSNNRKDFIVFDSAGINEKEVLTEERDTNVSKISNPENTIIAGKVMEATLETAIVSESEGTVSAVMSRDVYGESGRKILIPKGSRLYGSYTTVATVTQTRLLLTWTKIVRPDNVVITINADTYDQGGKKGIEGDINTRYGELFKNSLLYSFITLGTAVAIEKIAGIKGQTSIVAGNGTSVTNTSPANAAATSVIETAQDIAEKMTKGLPNNLNPIISIRQGMLLKVVSKVDVVVPEEYKREGGLSAID